MKSFRYALMTMCALLCGASIAHAQPPRLDAIWARATASAPVLDGVLDEPAWAQAESMVVKYGYDAGIPGSGFKTEGGVALRDTTRAVIKLLVSGNQMYMAVTVRDSSVGGSMSFNRFDGFLMSIKNHSTLTRPAPPNEYLYSWWYPTQPDPQAAGKVPSFKGVWAVEPPGTPRTAEQIANWDAVTRVHGLSNSDAAPDTGYTVEMRFNLTPMGYDVTTAAGDIVEWNISIYDCDWNWPNTGRMGANRVWWQGPWGGDALYNEVRVYAKNSVTTSSGALPTLAPELIIPNASGFLAPTINGTLTEPVWASAPSFDIRYGDQALRNTYPGVFKFRAGQYQPPINGGQAFVEDPGDATVKYFFKEDTLFLGFDVRDKKVQYAASFDRWDGALVSINDRAQFSGDQNLVGQRLSFQVAADGTATPHDYLAYLVTQGQARVALALKPGTTVDTTGVGDDAGYTAELAIDLTSLGYPKGRGDGLLFMGINLLDGDAMVDWQDSYGTRTWWMREYEGSCCPTWAYMSATTGVVGVDDPPVASNGYFQLLGNRPNPLQERTTIRFVMARPGDVTLDVYDVQGRQVASKALGPQAAGERSASFEQKNLRTGVYLYRLTMSDRATRTVMATLSGNMLVIR